MGQGVWLTQAEDIKAVFTADPSLVHAGEGNEVLGPILGSQSVLLVDEDDHLRRRKLMLPMFHGKAIQAYHELMGEVAAAEIETWKPGVMRLHPRMQSLTLEIICARSWAWSPRRTPPTSAPRCATSCTSRRCACCCGSSPSSGASGRGSATA